MNPTQMEYMAPSMLDLYGKNYQVPARLLCDPSPNSQPPGIPK